jgi:hypothetical protein
MGVPIIVTPPIVEPVINKTYTDIKFFVKNAETTKAFVEIPFTGTGNTHGGVIYPNADFSNLNTGIYPYIDLVNLSTNYEITAPISLGTGTVEGNTVTGDTSIFTDISIKTYLLYRNDAITTYEGAASNLKVLGYVQTKTSNTVVVLSADVPVELEDLTLELFTWEGTNNDENLNTLNFNFQDNFYMVVKNADYEADSDEHDAVLLIDTARTSANYTTSPQPFAYSANKIINPGYFSMERISKIYNPITAEEDENITRIPCSIKGVSKWSEKSMFEGSIAGVDTDEIPYWSVYEVIPHANSGTHLDKNSFHRLTIRDSLPSSEVFAEPIVSPE